MKHKEQLTLKNDIVFKAVYGRDTKECKIILMALLNLILDRKEDPIVEITYKNPFQVREHKMDKESVLDIKVETDNGELIDIEMQIITYDYLIDRTVYYHAGTIRESLKKGQSYDKLLKSITICIVDGILFDESDEFLNIFELRERRKGFRLTDRSQIYYIELPKVNRQHKPIEGLTPLETCLEYVRRAGETQDDYVKELVAHGGEDLKMAQHILEEATAEEILREKALAREKWVRDMAQIKSNMENSYKWGMEKGIEQGIEKGIEKGMKQGIEKGIYILIEDNLAEGKNQSEVLRKLQNRYSLTEKEAEKYLHEFEVKGNR